MILLLLSAENGGWLVLERESRERVVEAVFGEEWRAYGFLFGLKKERGEDCPQPLDQFWSTAEI